MSDQITGASVAEGEIVDENTVAEVSHPALRNMLQLMKMEVVVEDRDSAGDFVLDIMEEILTAESIDDIFAAQDKGTIAGKDFSNRPFWLATDGISVLRTNLENSGLPFYVQLKIVEIATGEELTLSCGGRTFVTILHRLQMKNYFDPTEESPLGKSVVIIATPSPEGAYLSLKPYQVARAAPARGRK